MVTVLAVNESMTERNLEEYRGNIKAAADINEGV